MCELQYVSKSRQAPQHNKETILYINKLHLQIAQTSLFRYFKLFLCFSTTLHDDDDVAAADDAEDDYDDRDDDNDDYHHHHDVDDDGDDDDDVLY